MFLCRVFSFEALSSAFWKAESLLCRAPTSLAGDFKSASNIFLASLIFFFHIRLWVFFLLDCLTAFSADLVFGIIPGYDNIQNGMVKSVLLKTQNTILSAAFVLALSSAFNALLGFVKSRLLASAFGVSDELSVFYTADRIPNLIYSILVVGALSTIFIPIFAGTYKNDKAKAWKAASSIINVTLGFFLVTGLVIFLCATPLMRALSVGRFSQSQIDLGASLMRIMMLGQFVLVASSFLTSVLQSFKYFIIPALAPVAYNLGMIFGIAFLSPRLGIYGPALGVIIGAVLHLLIQLPLMAHINSRFYLSFSLKDKGILEMFKLLPPRILSVLIANVLYIVNNALAILVSTPSVVYLKFASQLQFFPVSLFGISMASAALPTLSHESGENDKEMFKKTFLTSLHQMFFLVMPISVIFLVLRIPMVRIVYGADRFPWEATLQTAHALGIFSLSIFAQSAIYLITRAFYAQKDTLTPVKVSLVTVVINVILSLTFINIFHTQVWGVAASFSITSILDMILMLWLLSKRFGGFNAKQLFYPFGKIGLATLFMGISLYIPIKVLDITVFDTTRTLNLLVLSAIACVAGSTSYLIFTKIFRVEEIDLFYKLIKKLSLSKRLLSDTTDEKPEI